MLLAQVVDPSQAKEWLTETNYTVTGVVLVILAAVAFALWRVCGWIGKEFLIPCRDKLFIAVDKLLSNLEQNTGTMQDVSCSLQKLSVLPEKVDGLSSQVSDLSHRMDSVDQHLNRKNS
jgi:hypothetical protein